MSRRESAPEEPTIVERAVEAGLTLVHAVGNQLFDNPWLNPDPTTTPGYPLPGAVEAAAENNKNQK